MKRRAIIALVSVTLVISLLLIWVLHLDSKIHERFSQKRFASPIEFYAAGDTYLVDQKLDRETVTAKFRRLHLRQRTFAQPLQPGDFAVWSGSECAGLLHAQTASPILECLAFRLAAPRDQIQIAALGEQSLVLGVFSGSPPSAAPSLTLPEEMFAQYYGTNPVLSRIISLGEVPVQCLNAVVAIEDAQFLEHGGVSLTAIGRAFLTNLRSGRVTQGGSTITQQLVKNYFLSDERTLSRKLNEFAMALLLEGRYSKEEILEAYVNVIYMGQTGPFQIRGFAAAAEHYFETDLKDLNLEQCAMLAALVNSPGLFNPFTKPENALKRRNRVIDRMVDRKLIDTKQADNSKAKPLPMRPARALTEPAPYYVQAVRKKLQELNINESEGLKVFTGLNMAAQEAAQVSIREGISRLEETNATVKKVKEKGQKLEGLLVSANVQTGAIEAMVGGRSYAATQFDRVTDGHRQVGSIMKPFVFLSALESLTPEGTPFTPITLLKDEPFEHRYEGQVWAPHNYDGKFFGTVPMYFALKESLNSATAQLGLQVGLGSVVDVVRRLGITSKIEQVPALTLGAFELYPLEVLKAYVAMARMGSLVPLDTILRIEDLSGHSVFERHSNAETKVAPETMAELVGMMKQTLVSGSAKSARVMGFTHPAAGKTGTTNDKKDAWFSGYTPYHAAVVWVGYDDNTPHGLTGASGALPIWTSYMVKYATRYPAKDFAWPESVKVIDYDSATLKRLGVPVERQTPPETASLVFKR